MENIAIKQTDFKTECVGIIWVISIIYVSMRSIIVSICSIYGKVVYAIRNFPIFKNQIFI